MSILATVENHVLGIKNFNEVYQVCQPFSADWEEIGCYLDIIKATVTVTIIKEDNSRAKGRLSGLIAAWLKRDGVKQPLPTWRMLCKAIARVDRISAKEIARKHQCHCDKCTPESQFSQNIIDAAMREAMKYGSGTTNGILILMHGAPQAGKSSVKLVIEGELPLKQNSTGVMESPVRLISTSRLRIASKKTGKVLSKVGDKELIKMLAAHLHQEMKKNVSSTEAPTDSEEDEVSMIDTTNVLKDVANELPGVTDDSISLFDVQWIYLVDCGGQPQFSDVVRLMFQSATLHIVVIRLDKTLDEKPKIEYIKDGENQYDFPECLSLSSLEMIQRTCELANSDPKRPQSVMIVGTRLDHESREEPLDKKNERLKVLLPIYENTIVPASSQGIIFAMNAVTNVPEDRKKYTRQLQEVILEAPKLHENDITVPANWMLFDLEVQRHSTEEGILQKSVFLEVAETCYLNEEGMEEASQYFTEAGLHMHYPKVIPDLVFTSVTPVVKRLTSVISESFCFKKCLPLHEGQPQLRAGKLTKSLLVKLFKKQFDKSVFSVEKFLALLEYFHIAVEIDKNTYFLPCLLPLDDPTDKIEKCFTEKCDPLVFVTEKKSILPQGFFPGLVVEMMKSYPTIELQDRKQLRRSIALSTGSSTTCGIRLVDRIWWFDVYLSGDVKYCPDILKAVEDSVKRISEHLEIDYQLKQGFHCPPECCTECLHPCILTDDKGGAQCSLDLACYYTKEDLKYEKKQYWLKPPTGIISKSPKRKYVFCSWESMFFVAILVISVLVALIGGFCGWKFHYQENVKTTETIEKDKSYIPEEENLLVHLNIISQVLPFCTHLRLPAHDCSIIRAQNPVDLEGQKFALLTKWRAVKKRTWKEFIIPFALLSECVKAKELANEHSVYFDPRLKEDHTVLNRCKDINDHDS